MSGYSQAHLRRRIPVDISDVGANLHPLLRRVYANRGIHSAAEINLCLHRLADMHGLQGMEDAVELLCRALLEDWPITIVGDYDADGATSTALAVEVLRAFGVKRVNYLVPNRISQGYGLSPPLSRQAAAAGTRLLITVDNGISAYAGVKVARDLGLKVLVTDHHLPGETLPLAHAIVNPNLPNCRFPSKSLAGVGVIFYVMLALRARLREINWFARTNQAEPNLGNVLDLVALGTVADMVTLDTNNRILVEQGLQRMRTNRTRPGIQSLLSLARKSTDRLMASDLGFAVAPRLNAAGRLQDMGLGIECLLTRDKKRAMLLAQQLDELNHERRSLERETKGQALAIVESAFERLQGNTVPAAICQFDPDWHEGIIGLVAGRLKDHFHRPTAIFSASTQGEIKGSVRSIPGIHIRDVLAEINTLYPHLIKRFGGHAMAAGLAIDRVDFDEFTAVFAATVEHHANAEIMQPVVWSDGEIDPQYLCLMGAQALEEGGPWGQGFPEPLFDGLFIIANTREVGQHHLRLRLVDPRDGNSHEAMAFNYKQLRLSTLPQSAPRRFAFRLSVNDYRGVYKSQLIIQGYDFELAE